MICFYVYVYLTQPLLHYLMLRYHLILSIYIHNTNFSGNKKLLKKSMMHKESHFCRFCRCKNFRLPSLVSECTHDHDTHEVWSDDEREKIRLPPKAQSIIRVTLKLCYVFFGSQIESISTSPHSCKIWIRLNKWVS